ncbi:MAG: hypothetical protein J07HR59_00650 [Halorubrum sp. J07HR59]|nr:MAG: hypothetical protein J07HR59_00650 [Halorubrum sp. J07HR59]
MNPTTRSQSTRFFPCNPLHSTKHGFLWKIDMRCAGAGNSLMLKTATSESQLLPTHHRSPPSSTWHVIPENFPQVVATERWADGPACCSCGRTPVSATLRGGAGNTERIRKKTTPSFEGRSCISEPARSQPQLSGVPDN